MPNKRKICTEHNTANQNTFIAALNSWYPIENVLNSGYRKVLDFKENAEKILEKEAKETLTMEKFAEAIYSNRQFGIKVVNNCIILSCYITLEKDKDIKKKRSDLTPPATPVPSASNQQIQNLLASIERPRFDSAASSSATDYYDEYGGLTSPCNYTGINSQSTYSLSKITDINNNNTSSPSSTLNASGSSAQISGGAKKVNVEVIMKSNPLRVDENEKTTRMELIRSGSDNNMLRFTYYVKPECEVKKFRDTSTEMFEKGNLIVFTNDFFTIYKCSTTGKSIIALNEIIQNQDQEVRTEALGEKLATLLSSRPRHRALLTNECKLNHALSNADNGRKQGDEQQALSSQEDETYYTRELIHIYGQPIVPSFHKHFNYQLSNTHYGYRTLRRLLNCDILKKYVKITKEEIKSLDRVVEFVQLTEEGCLKAFKLNLTIFHDPSRFQNGIVKGYMDVWYVDRLKERYGLNESTINKDFLCSSLPQITQSPWSSSTTKTDSCFLQTTSCELEGTECDQTNHLWFCLQDYGCKRIEEFMLKIQDYITIKNNKSELILVHTLYPVFEYKDILSEARRILSSFLVNSVTNVCLNELISSNIPVAAREHVESLLNKYINLDSEKKIVSFTALFEILLILKRELSKEKNDEMKYSHFLCTLERAHHEKLKLAIAQLKCVPCLNKFTTNFSLTQTPTNQNTPKTMVNHANMSRLLKQMSLIVSTELQQVAIEIYEIMDDDKPVKYIKLKDEFKMKQQKLQLQTQQSQQQQQQQQPQIPQTPQSIQIQQSQQQQTHVQANTNSQNNIGSGTPASVKTIQKPTQQLFAPRNLLSSLNQQQPSPQQQQYQNSQLQLQQARLLANMNQSQQQQQQQLRSLNSNTNDHSNNPHLLQNAAAAAAVIAAARGLFNPHASLQNLQDITDKLDTTFVTDPNNTNAHHATNRS